MTKITLLHYFMALFVSENDKNMTISGHHGILISVISSFSGVAAMRQTAQCDWTYNHWKLHRLTQQSEKHLFPEKETNLAVGLLGQRKPGRHLADSKSKKKTKQKQNYTAVMPDASQMSWEALTLSCHSRTNTHARIYTEKKKKKKKARSVKQNNLFHYLSPARAAQADLGKHQPGRVGLCHSSEVCVNTS